MSETDGLQVLERENAELRERLAEAEAVLHAIRRGEIDAVVVGGPQGERVFTLENADQPYRRLVESMNEGAATLSSDGILLYANARLASLLGVAISQLTGTPLESWTAPEDRASLSELVRVTGTERAAGELTLLTGTGAPLPVHASFSTLVFDDAELYCAIITDLSLAKHQAELEAAARQIQEANERLREADRRKDEFLATLAHELRNPLAPIRSAAHLLKVLNPSDPTIVRARDIIERQITHLARLVDDLLELSRITLGRIVLQRQTEDLKPTIERAVEAMRDSIDTDHELTVDLSDEPLPVDVDAVRLSQAVSNILDNAIKYTPPGGRIALRVGREGREAVIRISDTGIGISPETAPRIFDMFVRIENEGQSAQGGLGIGLALSRRLVETHGGTIDVESAGRGCGSEFIVRLPLCETEMPENVADGRDSGVPFAPKAVLVVDDNVDAAESLRALLELSGHIVKAVHDGTAALDVLQEFEADVVLLDIGLPDLDGYEVARRLRQRHGTRCPTLVALSGWGRDEDKRRASAAGIDAHFTKPLDPAALASLFE